MQGREHYTGLWCVALACVLVSILHWPVLWGTKHYTGLKCVQNVHRYYLYVSDVVWSYYLALACIEKYQTIHRPAVHSNGLYCWYRTLRCSVLRGPKHCNILYCTDLQCVACRGMYYAIPNSALPCIAGTKYYINLYCKVPQISLACSVLHAVAYITRFLTLHCNVLLVLSIASACKVKYPTWHWPALCSMQWPV